MITVALIDDNPEILDKFSHHFTSIEKVQITALELSIEEFILKHNENKNIDILFLDIDLPGKSGLEALPSLKVMLPNTDIIIFTVHEDSESLIKAFCAGATGYLLKSTPIESLYNFIEIIQLGGSAISTNMAKKLAELVSSKEKSLSILNEKELQVLELLAEGWSYKLIANRAGLSTDGVRFYIKRIYRALNINSKGEALRLYYRGDLGK